MSHFTTDLYAPPLITPTSYSLKHPSGHSKETLILPFLGQEPPSKTTLRMVHGMTDQINLLAL